MRNGLIAALASACIIGMTFLGSELRSGGASSLRVGFADVDITPDLSSGPVYLAGFGHNRRATGVHDPLRARAVVLSDGRQLIALAAVDLIGLFNEPVLRVRHRLPAFNYVLVASTHNHEGPDTLGLWGPTAFSTGAAPAYVHRVEDSIVTAIQAAHARLRPAHAAIGAAKAPELLYDSREPYVKLDDLVTLRFADPQTGQPIGALVQWNCHPETLSSGNTLISADFVGYTIDEMQHRLHAPVVFVNGAVGGLMTSLQVPVRDPNGKLLPEASYAKTERYGRLIGERALRSLAGAQPVELCPFQLARSDVFLPLDNPLYRLARQIGILNRQAYAWSNDPYHAEPVRNEVTGKLALRTELAWLSLNQLDIAAIPGEIYPELVLGRVQDPADPGADFPEAPIEPAIGRQLAAPHRMLIGLANDEIGYIIPKRQWDEKPPYCYGRSRPQYGEVNSVGPDTAPILCGAFRDLVHSRKPIR